MDTSPSSCGIMEGAKHISFPSQLKSKVQNGTAENDADHRIKYYLFSRESHGIHKISWIYIYHQEDPRMQVSVLIFQSQQHNWQISISLEPPSNPIVWARSSLANINSPIEKAPRYNEPRNWSMVDLKPEMDNNKAMCVTVISYTALQHPTCDQHAE